MGLNYSFEIITSSENVLKLIDSFSNRLSKKDRDLLSDITEYEPENEEIIQDTWGNVEIIKQGFKLPTKEKPINSYCFSLLPEVDETIEKYISKRSVNPNIEDGKYSIGCVYTRMYVGKESVLLSLTAATSDMSRLFASSESLNNLCEDIAKEVENTWVFLDKEDELYWWQISPGKKKVVHPDFDLFSNGKTLNVDAYTSEVERLVGKFLDE